MLATLVRITRRWQLIPKTCDGRKSVEIGVCPEERAEPRTDFRAPYFYPEVRDQAVATIMRCRQQLHWENLWPSAAALGELVAVSSRIGRLVATLPSVNFAAEKHTEPLGSQREQR